MTPSVFGGAATQLIRNTEPSLSLLIKTGSASIINGPNGLPEEQITSGGTRYYYHQDQIGSTLSLSDSTGTQVQSYTYDPYGNLTGSSGVISNPFEFQGQYLDSNSTLYFLRARYYDPSTGQFMSVDPAVGSTRRPYCYVLDNPLNSTDPSGLLNWGAGWNALVQGVSSLRPTENNDPNYDAWNPLDTGYLAQQNAQELSNPSDWGSANAYRVATDDAKFGFTLGATYCGGRALAWGAEASGFSGWAAGNSVLGRAGPVFGRGGAGALNSNNYVRLGWGWKGPATTGKEIFRLVFGSTKIGIGPWHVP